jgi:site-specific recombinase XerC
MGRRLPKCLRRMEADAVVAAARKPRDRLLALTGLLCGLRVSELHGLDVEDINRESATLMVRRGKGDKDRSVPIPDRLLTELAQFLAGRTNGPVFLSRKWGARLGVRAMQLIVQRLGERAGLPRRVTCHQLRHSYAQRLLETGATIMEVRDLLGHSSVATTQVYLFADPSRMRAAVNRAAS